MTDLQSTRIMSIKKKIEENKKEIERLQSAGALSPLERMRITSLNEAQKELDVKLKELGR
ncbi:MAG: hypothetical protein GY863_15985 [bacterium]|nr:hypothetical protein [bacterium]